jgi:hypothetical protein
MKLAYLIADRRVAASLRRPSIRAVERRCASAELICDGGVERIAVLRQSRSGLEDIAVQRSIGAKSSKIRSVGG